VPELQNSVGKFKNFVAPFREEEQEQKNPVLVLQEQEVAFPGAEVGLHCSRHRSEKPRGALPVEKKVLQNRVGKLRGELPALG